MEGELGRAGRCFESRWVPHGAEVQVLRLPLAVREPYLDINTNGDESLISNMEDELLVGASLFAKECVGNTTGFEPSVFRCVDRDLIILRDDGLTSQNKRRG
jgi:hypothetical protein